MKKLLLSFALLTVFSFASKAQNADGKTLYERLGERAGITKIVDDAIEAHMNNPAIQSRFTPYKEQPERLAVIKGHFVDFFSAGSGAPDAKYTGRDMPTAHRGMNISIEEYFHVVDDVLKVLDAHKIDEESKKDVLYILWSLQGSIVEK